MGQKWTVTVPVLQYDVYHVETEDDFKNEDDFEDWFWNHYMNVAEPPDPETYGGESGESTTYECEPPPKTSNLQCPACGSCGDFRYIEDIGCARDVIVGDPDDTPLKIHGYYTTEGFDEGGENARFECINCGHEWPVPDGLEIEWV